MPIETAWSYPPGWRDGKCIWTTISSQAEYDELLRASTAGALAGDRPLRHGRHVIVLSTASEEARVAMVAFDDGCIEEVHVAEHVDVYGGQGLPPHLIPQHVREQWGLDATSGQ